MKNATTEKPEHFDDSADIEFTPFGVNSLKFPCLTHLGKYLLPLILCRAQAW
jgi:hypothetical protein